MTVLRRTVASRVLGAPTTISAVLPPGRPAATCPTLYLLHGLGGDDQAWLRQSSVAAHAVARGLAVVMPSLTDSFGVDEAHGKPYATFLAEELPELVHRELGLDPARERTFVAGLSMGGYAALRWALASPDRFAAAAALSGSLDIADPARYLRRPLLMHRLFGGRTVRGTDDDLFSLVARADPSASPALYVACGAQDTHLAENARFVDAARARGLPVTLDVRPGAHEWTYWDRTIPDVLAWLPATRTGSAP